MFCAFLVVNIALVYNFPTMTAEQKSVFKKPQSGEDLTKILSVIQLYSEDNFNMVLSAYVAIYLNMMSVGIPGTLWLIILSGPIFGGYWRGFFITYFCSIFGCSLCYFMSSLVGVSFFERTMPDKLNWMRGKVEANKDNIFYYFLFLRLSPFIPNAGLNLVSGVAGVPFKVYLAASLIGRLAYHLILVKLGNTLSDMTTMGLSKIDIAMLFGMSVIALVPSLLVKDKDTSTKKKTA